MFENLAQKLQSFLKPPTPLNPAQFGDPVALQTAWKPLRGGGSNFRTHRLKEVDTLRVEFRPSFGALFFASVFFFPGLALSGFMVAQLVASPSDFWSEGLWVAMLIGVVFATVGSYLFISGSKPIVFDKGKSLFWKGRASPSIPDATLVSTMIGLDQIHALQVVSERCSGNKGSFTSYELNLVLQDGRRLNVVDHGNRRRLLEDAARLSSFLGCPLWDATDRKY